MHGIYHIILIRLYACTLHYYNTLNFKFTIKLKRLKIIKNNIFELVYSVYYLPLTFPNLLFIEVVYLLKKLLSFVFNIHISYFIFHII